MDFIFQQLGIWLADSALTLLFVTGFFSATLLPGGSEAALLATLSLKQYSIFSILLVATLGNTLGGLTNYGLGRWIPNRTQDEKYGHKALQWVNKYGYWALLLSWTPIIGDPLCLAAGWLRMRFVPCLIFILVGKLLRYIMLVGLFTGFGY
ncbi:YqaA family protein [Vibrio gallicus]|uniref:YqaA family protein n=1 Tax=Vibrio gallicus TaxID=190897 RepID=UPI0021C3C6B3|nr:YqaA family protein [Vibrio gallicus]